MRGSSGSSRPLRAAFLGAIGLAGLLLGGCSDAAGPPPAPATPRFRGVKLVVAALDDAAILTGLAAQRGEWVASRGGEIEIRPEPLSLPEALAAAELVIFPGERLGGLVDLDALETIPDAAVMPPRPTLDQDEEQAEGGTPEPAADVFQYTDLAPVFRDQASKYGSDRVALPLGGSALVLVYRKDALARPANMEAARGAGLTLQPPATWSQLDALSKFFQGRDWDGDGKPDFGLAAALGSDPEGVGNALYLCRAASLGQHRDQFSFLFDADELGSRVGSPPFVEALSALVAWKSLGPPGMEGFDAQAAREAFRAGRTAFLIDRAEKAHEWSVGHPVGVAPLPGSDRVFEPLRKVWETPSAPNSPSYLPRGGGWLIGVRRGLDGARREAAIDLAVYLASPDNANRLRAERSFPMLPVRTSQLGRGLPDPTSAPDVDPRQWSDAVSRTVLAERVLPGLRIPDAEGYLAELAKARAATMAGQDSASALRELGDRWSARSRALGRERQLWHYRRSLNSLSTAPRPPAPANR